jgi:hypothetical protein
MLDGSLRFADRSREPAFDKRLGPMRLELTDFGNLALGRVTGSDARVRIVMLPDGQLQLACWAAPAAGRCVATSTVRTWVPADLESGVHFVRAGARPSRRPIIPRSCRSPGVRTPRGRGSPS